MTKELYGDVINQTANNVVMKELSQGAGDGAKNNNEPISSYIAVQHKVSGINVAALASALDEVSRNYNNATIVFFAAGTVAWHDSFDIYANVQKLMKQPSMVYPGEHVWKVVALISRADAVLSTSLHVRIMSFIFHRPRVTWCTGHKHRKFIELWDAPDASNCVEKVEQSWQTLQKYIGPHPERNQDQTKEAYRKAVHLYIASFDKWSGMLQ
jgi:Polysaccharide pyruvyl transferase